MTWTRRGAIQIGLQSLGGLAMTGLGGCSHAGPQSGPDAWLHNSRLDGSYKGADAGTLITALTAETGTGFTSLSLIFRRRDGSDLSRVYWGQKDNFDLRPLDIVTATETGVLDVRPLPPGDYEIFNYDCFTYRGAVSRNVYMDFSDNFSAKGAFSIPFTIQPGRATYVGAFRAIAVPAKNLIGMTVTGGAYFILTDQRERDTALARGQMPQLGPVDDAVIEPASAGSNMIRSTYL